MPPFGPIARRELVNAFRRAGFIGPFAGGRHEFMQKEDITLRIPNPHQGDIGKELLARILRQAGISKDEWENL
ncbi:MAG TPA: type II toxin-antitoxin system HicA family toxin [Armatimonadota bacterium]|jgi:predicted RNA binding protein YcfA (HicA-like mRNA interferase family)